MSAARKSKAEKEREKQIQERLQVLLTQMLKDEDNKYCVDCDAKGGLIDNTLCTYAYSLAKSGKWVIPH